MNEKNIFTPILLCDFLRQNRHLLIKNLTKEQFESIFDKLLLKNFGELQTKRIILKNICLKESTFKENIENNKKILRYIGDTKMYFIPNLSQFICKTYYLKYLGGTYEFYNQKPS